MKEEDETAEDPVNDGEDGVEGHVLVENISLQNNMSFYRIYVFTGYHIHYWLLWRTWMKQGLKMV